VACPWLWLALVAAMVERPRVGVYGLLCMRLVGADMAAWLDLLFAGLYVSCHIKNGNRDAAYGGHQAAIAIIMSMVQDLPLRLIFCQRSTDSSAYSGGSWWLWWRRLSLRRSLRACSITGR
jgi:hypothetical protein